MKCLEIVCASFYSEIGLLSTRRTERLGHRSILRRRFRKFAVQVNIRKLIRETVMSYSDFQLAVASIAPSLAFRGCLTLVLVM